MRKDIVPVIITEVVDYELELGFLRSRALQERAAKCNDDVMCRIA